MCTITPSMIIATTTLECLFFCMFHCVKNVVVPVLFWLFQNHVNDQQQQQHETTAQKREKKSILMHFFWMLNWRTAAADHTSDLPCDVRKVTGVMASTGEAFIKVKSVHKHHWCDGRNNDNARETTRQKQVFFARWCLMSRVTHHSSPPHQCHSLLNKEGCWCGGFN